MIRKITFIAALLLSLAGVARASALANGTTYVLKNVATGLYLGGGNNWGTQASLLQTPQQFTLADGTDGKYTLCSYQYNSATSHFLENTAGVLVYVDGSSNEWTIAASETTDGAYTISNTTGYLQPVANEDGTYAFCVVQLGEEATDGTTDWELISLGDVRESMASATAENGVDVTGLIWNPTFGRHSQTDYETHWTVTAGGTVNFGYGNASDTSAETGSWCNAMEAWEMTFDVNQTITLPAGVYELSAHGLYLEYSSNEGEDNGNTVMYAATDGDDYATTRYNNISSEDGVAQNAYNPENEFTLTMAQPGQDFRAGLYLMNLSFTVEDDDTEVTIGFRGDETTEWAIAGELNLTYYGPVPAEGENYSAGDVIPVDDVEYIVVGENLIANNSFEEATETDEDGNVTVPGWTNGEGNPLTISESTFALVTGEAADGIKSLNAIANAGGSAAGSIRTAWEIENGKTYVLSYYVKTIDGTETTVQSADGASYLGFKLLDDVTDGDANSLDFPGSIETNPLTVTGEWQQVKGIFTNTEGNQYLRAHFRWLGNFAFDDFQLFELSRVCDSYDVMETVHECEAELGEQSTLESDGYRYAPKEWTISDETIPTWNFHINTWSSDDVNMSNPYVEYWVWSENLAHVTITHDVIENLPNGFYDVSMLIRAVNESGTEGASVGSGTIFAANDASADLSDGDHETSFGTADELFGTYHLLAQVTDATQGKLTITLTTPESPTYSWLAWKNLSVVYMGEEMPVLEALEGKMSATVQAAMEAALKAYEDDPTAETFADAEAALDAAQASIDYYAEITAVVEALDEAGAAVWAADDNAKAYEDCSLDGDDISASLAAAQKAQTTAGSNMDYVIATDGEWIGQTGDYLTGVEHYSGGDDFTASEDGDLNILYKTITDLTPGVYTVTFYAALNAANGVTGTTSGDGIAEIYANDGTEDLTVGTLSASDVSDLSVFPYTFESVAVGDDGTLTFGIRLIEGKQGGNWALCQGVGLVLEATATGELDAYNEAVALLTSLDESGLVVDEDAAAALAAGVAAVLEDAENATLTEVAEALTAINAAIEAAAPYALEAAQENADVVLATGVLGEEATSTITTTVSENTFGEEDEPTGAEYVEAALAIQEAYATDDNTAAVAAALSTALEAAEEMAENMTSVDATEITALVEADGALISVGEDGAVTTEADIVTLSEAYIALTDAYTTNHEALEALLDDALSAADEVLATLNAKLGALVETSETYETQKETLEGAIAGLTEAIALYTYDEENEDSFDATTATVAEIEGAIDALNTAAASALATSIESAESAGESETQVIYTISGVRVSKVSQPGIYIVNGKKVIVK